MKEGLKITKEPLRNQIEIYLEQLYESNNHELYIRAVDSVGTVVF
jgi:hypothetical protein